VGFIPFDLPDLAAGFLRAAGFFILEPEAFLCFDVVDFDPVFFVVMEILILDNLILNMFISLSTMLMKNKFGKVNLT
jgi:hypothetical protein